MKIRSFLLAAVCVAHIGFAQTNRYPLKPEHVTVFLKGAEIYGKTKVNLVKGENEIVLTGLARNVDETSVMVNAGSDVTILSVSFRPAFTDSVVSTPATQAMKDSLKQMRLRRKGLANKVKALDDQLQTLEKNRKVNGDNQNVSLVELKKLLEFMKSETEAVLNEKDQVSGVLSRLDDQIRKVSTELDVEQAYGEFGLSKLIVRLLAKEARAANLSATYVTNSASWTPVYDIVADKPGQPVRIVYKANIRQDCGVNWDNVKLTLSTGNPAEGMEPPAVDPWHVSFYQPVMVSANYATLNAASTFSTYTWNADSLDVEDPVTANGKSTATSLNEHVPVDNGGVNTAFEIDLPYSIPGDYKDHLVAVKHFDMPAMYRYSAFPKEDKDAFLLARIGNWHDLNMLPGKTNIFYEGSYVGQGSISPDVTGDTLDISLGRDKKIVITRDQDKARRSARTLGSNVRETFAYTTTVRNNRKETVQTVVTDQLPISDDKDIVVEDTELSDGAYDEKTGAVKWTLNLQPGETKTIKFGFTLKYPKGKTLANGPR